MNQSRLQILRQYVEEDPDDPFNWYSLALEEQKENPAKAWELFNHLLAAFPDYIPTYYHAGILGEQLGNHDQAIKILRLGVQKCEAANNLKTKREIVSILEELED